MENYAQSKEAFLRTFLDLPNGIPSHDTFNRVFSTIELQPKEVIAIDEYKKRNFY